MKKQGVWVTRFIFLILFVFVMAFMGFHVVGALSNPVGTVGAVLYTTETTIELNGWFVRDEMLVPEPDGIWELQVEDGRRVAKSDTLALTYRDTSVQRENEEARVLEARLEQLRDISRFSADLADVSELDILIQDAAIELISSCDTGVISDLDVRSMTFKSLLYKRSYTYEGGRDVAVLIEELSDRLDRTRIQADNALGRVEAPISGAFCAQVDGYESLLTPTAMDEMDVGEFLDITRRSPSVPTSYVGKLARGFSWYYAVVLPEGDVGRMEPGDALVLRLSEGADLTLKAHVHRISSAQNGRCLLVLQGDEKLSRLVSLRNTPSEIVQETYTGVRVPREAVRLDNEGRTGVYCLVINQLKFKPVEIVLERDGYYIVAYQSEANNTLLPGDEVVVKGKDLFDGKIY